MVRILFFGATAAVVGERVVELPIESNSTSKNVFDSVLSKFPQLTSHKLLFSLNQNYSNGSEIVHDGDELAIFTAVSGG